jgi:hypothetical protein
LVDGATHRDRELGDAGHGLSLPEEAMLPVLRIASWI